LWGMEGKARRSEEESIIQPHDSKLIATPIEIAHIIFIVVVHINLYIHTIMLASTYTIEQRTLQNPFVKTVKTIKGLKCFRE